MARAGWDVVVVGAGPAGSTAARVAAAEGARVLLLERKAQIGEPQQCAGYVSRAIRWHVALPPQAVAQAVERLVTFLPDGARHQAEAPGYILNRAALDRHLALEAVKAGAHLRLKAAALGPRDGGVVVRGEGPVEATVIVGADGTHSQVRRWMGLAPLRRARALQYEAVLRRPIPEARVYFRPSFRGGYAWLFPRGETAWVGAAFVDGERQGLAGLRCLFAELVEDGVAAESALSFTAGSVPISGVSRMVQGNMALVGDAAGHTHPITGAGIVNAIIGGEMAGRAAARAAQTGNLGFLAEYEVEWREIMGTALKRAQEKRARLEANWDSPPEELARSLRQSWITFDEYYQAV